MRADAGSGVAAAPVKENATKDAIIPVDIADSWVVGSDRMDRDLTDTTKDYRAFFNKIKGAFRVGWTPGPEWDDANVGPYSFAQGHRTIASGTLSYATGETTTASGAHAHAEGWSSVASGARSHSEGEKTAADGNAAHAEGMSTSASGQAAHAEGTGTTASGQRSHAEGVSSTASGYGSHAQGVYTLASRRGQHAFSGDSFSAQGDAQGAALVVMKETTDAVAALLMASTTLTLTGEQTSVLTVTARRTFQLKVSTAARRTDAQGEAAGWTWDGVINRDASGDAYIVGTPVIAAWGVAASAAWDLTVSINTTDATNNYVAVTATGEAGKRIRWVAKMEWTEVGG